LGNQALILQDWGRLEEAMALHKQVEAICRELGDRSGLQCSLGNQALILKAWGRRAEALAKGEEALRICSEAGLAPLGKLVQTTLALIRAAGG
jgi:tetratricopeptide (TPR) repeat protein